MKNMNNDIEKNSLIKRKDLDERFYFKSIIDKAFQLGIIDLNIISNLQLQSLDLLKLRVEKYNGFDSTSILIDKANSIIESNIYTIGLYLKRFTPDDAIKELLNNNITNMYTNGRKDIDKQITISRILYKKVLTNKINTDNITYNDTIIGGMTGFFKIYDPDFEANNIKITADYPLYNNLIGILDGIEFIKEYLTSLYYENEFCNNFSEKSITYLLYGYSHDYKDLLINIFNIVLTATIGCILANEDVYKLTISNHGLEEIYNVFLNKTEKEIYELINESYNKLKGILLKNNLELQKYIEKGLSQVKFEIYNAVKYNNLDKLFIIEKFIDENFNTNL